LLEHGAFQKLFAVGGEIAECPHLAWSNWGAAEESFFGEAGLLDEAGADYAVAHFFGAFGFRTVAHFFVIHGRDIDVDIDAIEPRAGDFGDVALD
jgi:hypothetical protein